MTAVTIKDIISTHTFVYIQTLHPAVPPLCNLHIIVANNVRTKRHTSPKILPRTYTVNRIFYLPPPPHTHTKFARTVEISP